MHLLQLNHWLPRFCDGKRQHYLALLNALPPRLLGRCSREVPHQHISLHRAHPIIYALQGHEVVSRTILAAYLKSAVPSNARDDDIERAELAQEEEERRTEAAELGAKVRPVLGWRKAQVERGPATSGRVGGAPHWRDHPELRCAIKVEGVRAGGDVDFVGDGEDGLEADTLLAYRRIFTRKVKRKRVELDAPMKPRIEFSGVLVLAPISHIALTLSAEKPSSLHSNTTRLSSMRRFSEGMTSSASLDSLWRGCWGASTGGWE